MDAVRKCTVNGHKVEEFYWAGKYPVYVDNQLTNELYTNAVDRLKEEGRAANIKAKDELISEMLAALLQCQEYMKFSLGSTSEINPYRR